MVKNQHFGSSTGGLCRDLFSEAAALMLVRERGSAGKHQSLWHKANLSPPPQKCELRKCLKLAYISKGVNCI